MAKKDTTALGELMKEAKGMLAVNPMIAPQQEHFWKAQDRILEETEAFSKAWFARRHEATQSAIKAMQKLNDNGADPSSAVKAMLDWQQGSIKRMAEDMQQWVELCTTCAGRIAQAEVEAGKEGAEEIAKRAKSVAKTEHATPV